MATRTRGRTKKSPEPSSTVNEDTISVEISIPHANPYANNVEGLNVEIIEDVEVNGSKVEKETSEATNSSARRSLRLVGKREPAVRFNPVLCEKAASGSQVSSLPSPVQEGSNKIESLNDETIRSIKTNMKRHSTRVKGKQECVQKKKAAKGPNVGTLPNIEILDSNDETIGSLKEKMKRHSTHVKGELESVVNKALKGPNVGTLPNSTETDVEKEAPACPKSNNLGTMDMGNTVHLDSSGPAEKKIPESIRRSSRYKRETGSSIPVAQEKKASKRQKVIAPPSSTERSAEVVPPIPGPNVVQAVVQRNLVTKENTCPDGGTTLDGSYQSLYESAMRKVEQLMADNMELTNQLHFEHGKVEAYEKLMTVVMPLKCILPDAAAAAAPETAQGRVVPSPDGKKKRKYAKKKNATAA